MTATECSDNEESEPDIPQALPRTVPPIVEIAVVFVLAVLPDVCSSLVFCFEPITSSFAAIHLWMIVRALQVSAPVLLMIHLTGGNWHKHSLGYRLRPVDVAIAAALVVTGYFAGDVALDAMSLMRVNVYSDYLNPVLNEQLPHSMLILFLTITVSGIANGFAEELVMRSWMIPKLEEVTKSGVAAVGITSLFFAAYHLYQGFAGATMSLGIGIVFGAYFVCFRRFWPLVIAHAAMDVIPYYW
jgi:membrane protease YdiL (CAAX protease family)